MMHLLVLGLAAVLAAAGCQSPESGAGGGAEAAPPTAGISQVDPSFPVGQVLYVPAYSVISMSSRDRTMPLAVTLSVHNTDQAEPMVLSSVRFHDTEGKLLREFLPAPLEIPPLATRDFLVERRERQGGGIGANFVVTWGASRAVSKPIIEALIVSGGTQGISFISAARVISEKP